MSLPSEFYKHALLHTNSSRVFFFFFFFFSDYAEKAKIVVDGINIIHYPSMKIDFNLTKTSFG